MSTEFWNKSHICFGFFTAKNLTCRICVWLSTTLSSTFINLLSLSTFFYKVTNSFMIWLPSTCLLSAKNEGSVFGGNMIYFDLFSQNLSTAAHSVTIAITYQLCNPQMNQHNLVYAWWAEIKSIAGAKKPWMFLAQIRRAKVNFLWNCCLISYSDNHVSCHCYLNQL